MLEDQLTRTQTPFRFFALPPELRLLIYHFIFSGSRVFFTPHTRNNILIALRQGDSDAFQATYHWPVLLTCRLCYAEGLPVFWAETRLYARQDSFYIHSSLLHLARAVSDYTRENVRHLRRLDLVRGSEPFAARVLREFKRLRTCEVVFRPSAQIEDVRGELLDLDGWEEDVKQENPQAVERVGFLRADTRRYLERFQLDPEGKVGFVLHLAQVSRRHLRPALVLTKVGQADFVHLNTGRYYRTPLGSPHDGLRDGDHRSEERYAFEEEGFKRLLESDLTESEPRTL
jgi:hypothetical protein